MRSEQREALRRANRRAERREAALRDRRQVVRQELRRERRIANNNDVIARREARRARVRAWERQERRRERRQDVRFFQNARVLSNRGDRFVLQAGAIGAAIGATFVVNRGVDRFRWRADSLQTYVLDGGNRETVVVRPNGVRVVTVKDPNGIPIRRVKIFPDGRRVVLFNNAPGWWGGNQDLIVNVAPRPASIATAGYVVETAQATPAQIVDAVSAEPVEELDRSFTLNQVLLNDGVRDFMPRIDIAIRFRSGSSIVDDSQINTLEAIGVAIEDAVSENPDEVFLIEGHTDAVGSAISNLELSDARAEEVATLLTDYFEIPPENLVAQGFGENYLKLDTLGPSAVNRRVTVRRITPLLSTEDDPAEVADGGDVVFESFGTTQ